MTRKKYSPILKMSEPKTISRAGSDDYQLNERITFQNMTHLDEELKQLKSEIISMWTLVISQIRKTHEALITFDKDLAHEVVANEKRVNALELKIDRDCENIFAL